MGINLKNEEAGKVFLLSMLLGLVFLSLLNLVSALTSNVCDLNVSLINQDPYPAIPDSYVNLVFQISGVNNDVCNGAKIELLPSYPFSIDDNNSSLRVLSGNTWIANSKNEWMVAYKVRVDKDALDGDSEIEVGFVSGRADAGSYIHKKFSITIEDSRTNFDAVIQEISGSAVSIAIANAGKNTANSVVVRIPEQEYFATTGTNGQMVGNLKSGDYTIVSFELSKLGAQQVPQQNNNSRTNFAQQQANQASPLKFDIYYTDSLGIRRTVNMELPIKMSNTNSSMAAFFSGNRQGQRNNSLLSNWYITVPIILVIIAIAAFFVYRKRKHAKMISRTQSKETPDWINKKDHKK